MGSGGRVGGGELAVCGKEMKKDENGRKKMCRNWHAITLHIIYYLNIYNSLTTTRKCG